MQRLARLGTIMALGVVLGALAATPARAQGGPRRWRGPSEATLPPPPGTGRLRNVAQGMCLDVAGWATQGNANVLLWECNDDPDQVWSFVGVGELHDVLTGTCLDVAGYDGAQGANVDVFRCEGLDDQKWTLVPRGNGTFELHSLKRGLCLDVNGKAGGRGDDVLLWACDGGRDQLWRWEPHAAPAARQPPPPRNPPYPPGPPGPRAREWRREGRAMDDDAFRALVGAVRNERFADGQLNVIQTATTRNYFRAGQLKSLLDQLAFSATKLRALELGAPRVVDPENAFTLYDAFSFSADKQHARAILQRHGM